MKCDNINCEIEGNKTCGNCHDVYYCSVDCQRISWNTHKKECKVLQLLQKVTNTNTDIHERVKILDQDILKKNFSIVLKSNNYDLIDLLLEDLNVNFGIEASSNGVPSVCWTSYLLCKVFRVGNRSSNIFNVFDYTDMNLFIPFLTKVRVGNSRNEYGDPLSIILAICSILLSMCTNRNDLSVQRTAFLREDWLKSLLRCVNNILCNNQVCKFIFENEFRLNNAIDVFQYLTTLINGKDDMGLDPNSALEGLIYQSLAIFDIHASRYSQVISQKVKKEFSSLFINDIEKDFLYKNVAIPSAMGEISKWDR